MNTQKVTGARVIPLVPVPRIESSEDVFTDRLSLEKIKVMLGAVADEYTEVQLYKIREFAYCLCEVIYKIVSQRNTKTIQLSHE